MTRLGIVTGMQFEADIIRAELAKAGAPDSIVVACAGPSYTAARRTAERLLDEGSEALLSFGVAGALLEEVKSGTLLIASQVIHWQDTVEADRAWVERLKEALGKPPFRTETGNLAHSDPPAVSPADKRSLHILTKALGVDMESFGVGEIARDRGVPFLTLRVVADGATRILPTAALEAANPDGSVSAARALGTLALRPWETLDMVRLGLQTGAARKTLRNLASLGVPRLFFL
jgi:adenosylhomocysteine nucleosidase